MTTKKIFFLAAVGFAALVGTVQAAEMGKHVVLNPVTYREPVYGGTDGNPTNGIAYWTTGTVSSGDYTLVAGSTEPETWGTAGTTTWYVVSGDATVSARIACTGDVRLVLCDGCTLTASAGITVSGSANALTVYGQDGGTGALIATSSSYYAAAIGGEDGGAGENITINGGTVTAQGGAMGAGIGGGHNGIGRVLTVNGGTVTTHSGVADSGEGWAAGIGGGDTGNGLDITINGGNVTSYCEAWGAGLGGGGGMSVGKNLRINGGTVFAYSKYGANQKGESGLGSGCYLNAEGVYVGRYLQVKAEDNNPPTTEIAFTPGADISTKLDHLQYVKIEPVASSEIVIRATPAPEHATLAVYTNGCLSALRPGMTDEWYGASNRTIRVVYTADEGYAFTTGPKVLTYELEATTDPVVAPEPPAVQLVPVPSVAPAGEYRPTAIVNGGFEKYPWNDFKVAGSNDWIRDGLFFYSTVSGEYETNVTAVALKGTDEGWNTTDRLVWGEAGGLYEIYQDDLEPWGELSDNTNWLQRVSDGDHTVGVVNCSGRGYHWYPATAYGSSHLAGLGQGIFIEMNAVQRDTFYQDLSTKGGDVIRWTIKHAVRQISKEVQMISVHVGAPVTEGGEIVHPESPADLKIVDNTLGAYYASGVSNVNSYAYSSAAELAGLSLVTADSLGKWYPASGVYVVPEGQGVTRFAFKSERYPGESESATKEGNFLDDLTFSTLVGNLKAQANLDGSVTVTGYWGDTDASKTLVIRVGGKTLMLDMSNVLKQNFSVTIPSDTIGSATHLEVYHCDYEQAKRQVEIQHYVEVVPEEIPYAETGVYTNGAPVEKVSGRYYVLSNGTAYVVYTVIEPGYYFDGGVTVKTNVLDTSKNPAETKGDLPVVLDPVEYVAPVYVDNIASNGIAHWTTNEVYAYTIVTGSAACVTWGTAGETKWYVVTNAVTISDRITCEGAVHLILCAGAKLTASSGITVSGDAQSLAVYGQPDGAGELVANSAVATDAGIGGSSGAGENITLNGGTVTATGGTNAAGIGGGNQGAGRNLVVNGGTVTAKSLSGTTGWGAGIGGGDGGTGCEIVINGGTVEASNYGAGAAIGGGGLGEGYAITINGGNITSVAGDNNDVHAGAGIGGGCSMSGHDITINGGTVYAQGGRSGAGIGGGRGGAGYAITIKGGSVTAKSLSAAGGWAAGIGGGDNGAGYKIVISGGTVEASNYGAGAAIGGGGVGEGSEITITGGNIRALAGGNNYGHDGAGVGGGCDRSGHDIAISGGTVWIANGGGCELIGSGNNGPAASGVTIADTAKVMFDIANNNGMPGGQPLPAWDGFAILTPEVPVTRVLVGGVGESGLPGGQPLPFALTNAVTAATGEIAMNGEYVIFANKMLSLPHADNTLTLTVVDYSIINPPAEVAHTTATVYTNDAEAVVGEGLLVEKDTPAYVVYTAEGEYFLEGGTKVVTNQLNTAKNPAEMQGDLPKVLDPVEYVAPIYMELGGLVSPSNGIAYWTTNTVWNYTVVTSAAERVTWGAAGATSWYVVTNADLVIDGGVVCTGDVRLVLCDGAKLTVTNAPVACAGIQTDASGSFTIYGTPDGAGILDVTSGENAAGIGGNGDDGTVGSNITINGGDVRARSVVKSGASGAGIGGGCKGKGSDIVINGGVVYAKSVRYGAGIGGGDEGDGTGIVINGGVITVVSSGGAGIGGGARGCGSYIAINGGAVSICAAMIVWEEWTLVADFIGSGYLANAAGNVLIADSANVCFNLTGVWDGGNNEWLEEPTPMPGAFEGFVIMTPATQSVDRVLVGGCGDLVEATLPAFTLRKPGQDRTKEIEINGESVPFANAMLTLTNDVAGTGVLKLMVGKLPADPVVTDKDGNEVTVEVPSEWREKYNIQDEDAVDTKNVQTNGLPAWQNYAIGLDPTNELSVIYADTPQNTKEDKVTIVTKAVAQSQVAPGYGLLYRLDTRLRGDESFDKGPNQGDPEFEVAIDGADPTGHYQLNVVITSNDVELVDTAKAINMVGMVKQIQSATNVIVSVPWGKIAPGEIQRIAISNVVKTATLDPGDKLRVYSPGETNYVEWVLKEDKTWEAATTYKLTAGSSLPTVVQAAEPEDATIRRGSGIWLCRQGANKDKPYFLYGQANGDSTEIELVKGANLVGATGIVDYDLNEHVTGAQEGDWIEVREEDGVPKLFEFKNGAWGYMKSEKVTVNVKGVEKTAIRNTWTTSESKVKPGVGFWLYNMSGKVKVQ